MDIFTKHRLNHTISLVVLAAVFLLFIFGIFIGVTVGTNESNEQLTLRQALDAKNSMLGPNIASGDIRCFTYFDSKVDSKYSPNAEYYGDDLDDIIKLAIETQEGKFKYNDQYFVVANKKINGDTIYAIYDRTAHRKELQDRIIQLSILYCLALLLVGIIGYLISSKTLRPIQDAMEKQKDLIANASHELKTPLTVISANLDVIKSEPEASITDSSKEIETIDAQIERMRNLIQNMLELSKLEQTELPKEDINLSAVVEGVCLEFEAVCFEQGNTLISDISPNIHIDGDKNSLERLIVILLDNANKYCGENGKIGIRLFQEGKKNRLTVMNTGEVISQEDAKHIFDRFYRTDGARENKDKQSFGLGLSIAHATVLNHNGSIICKGIENKGTIFEVTFPVVKQK